MNNNLITPRMITFKCLEEFLNNLKVLIGFNTTWARDFGKKGMKIGDTELIRKPQRWISKNGTAYQPQPISDTYATLTIGTNKQIGYDWGAFEEVLSIDDSYERYFKTSITQIANDYDDLASQFAYLNTNNFSGVIGSNPATLADSQNLFLLALAILQENGCPTGDLTAVLSPRQAAAVMQYFNTNFNPQNQIGEEFRSGRLMSSLLGFAQASIDQNLWVHVVGTFTGTPLVSVASVNGDTQIVTNGWTANTDFVNAGDTFTVALVNNVNPKNRRSTNVLKRFEVAGTFGQQYFADGGGNMTLPLSGGLTLYDQNQQYADLDVLPAVGAALTFWPGTAAPSGKSGVQGLAFAPDAFAFASIELPKMDGCGIAEIVKDPKTQIALALHRGSDIRTFERISRVDSAGGFSALYPDNESCKMEGA